MQAIPPAMAPHVGVSFRYFIYTDLTYPHLKSSSVIYYVDVIFVKGLLLSLLQLYLFRMRVFRRRKGK